METETVEDENEITKRLSLSLSLSQIKPSSATESPMQCMPDVRPPLHLEKWDIWIHDGY